MKIIQKTMTALRQRLDDIAYRELGQCATAGQVHLVCGLNSAEPTGETADGTASRSDYGEAAMQDVAEEHEDYYRRVVADEALIEDAAREAGFGDYYKITGKLPGDN